MLYLVKLLPLEPRDFMWMTISIIAVSWMPVGGNKALPLRCRAAVGPGGCGVASARCLIHPTFGCAHHSQVFRVLTVVHPPAIVFTVLQRLLWALTLYIIHPYGACVRINNSFIIYCEFHWLFNRLSNASMKWHKWVPKHLTLDFYWHTDLGFHLSVVFSSRYTVFYKVGCCRSCSLNLLNLVYNLDLKAAVKNVHKPQQVLRNSGKRMLSLF